MAINPLTAALQERVHLLPRGDFRLRHARHLAARQSAAALLAAPDDPAVLAALGLYEAALAHAPADRDGRVARLVALAATGETSAVEEEARGLGLTDAEAARLARAAAPLAPAAALALAPAGDPLLRAALAFAADDLALAAQALVLVPPGREAAALAAGIAGAGEDWQRARTATAAMFAADGLQSPLEAASDRPVTFARLVEEGPALPPEHGPLVSVIVPVRDAVATLKTTVASLSRQSWRDLEILLVDDGSRDGSAKLAHDLAAGDPRIRCLVNTAGPGAAAARNTAIGAAAGEFLLFHDADDWAHPAKVARHMRMTAAGVGALSAHVRIDEGGVFRAPLVSPFVRYAPICLMVRAAAARRAGPIETARVGSDSEYLARLDLLFGRRRVARDPAVLTIFSWGTGSLSGDPRRGLVSPAGMKERRLYRHRWMLRHAAMGLPWRRFRVTSRLPGATGRV